MKEKTIIIDCKTKEVYKELDRFIPTEGVFLYFNEKTERGCRMSKFRIDRMETTIDDTNDEIIQEIRVINLGVVAEYRK